MNKIKNKKSGFTLAEVLIALTVLGVIAAITIPSIIRNFQDRAQITGVKKAYAMFDNAFSQAFAIEGNLNTWDFGERNSDRSFKNNTTSTNLFIDKFYQYLPVEKYCGSSYGCMQYGWCADGVNKNCSSNNFYKTLKNVSGLNNVSTNVEADGTGKAVLKGGTRIKLINFLYRADMGGIFGIFRVDINGEKGPNRFGYDVFFFPFNKYGIMIQSTPRGTRVGDYYQYIYNSPQCNMYNAVTDHWDGLSCYHWIIRHNNMDYKYKDVSSQW